VTHAIESVRSGKVQPEDVAQYNVGLFLGEEFGYAFSLPPVETVYPAADAAGFAGAASPRLPPNTVM
jgi:hypothetical protein